MTASSPAPEEVVRSNLAHGVANTSLDVAASAAAAAAAPAAAAA
eukprot:CAMPEP_0171139962 /NCGR_PEP_ID=MMETSP0766_2-20121228/137826_1 /TAXON_ID=439317 /ORGANISM="Gambierdiscus australes, Strain CAWD 149" /LENGTH=43 /DNA_ID= /DNA_START= /DNA_END= /DNA_ORIENTATION=